jgi:tripartite-type tricarboxylate transporter receptor subunit TctC
MVIRFSSLRLRTQSRLRSTPISVTIRRGILRLWLRLESHHSHWWFRPLASLGKCAISSLQRRQNRVQSNFSSPGVATASHLSAERFCFSAGVRAVHVPFKGGVEAMTEVMAGRIDFFFVVIGAALPHIQSGKLTALAVNGAKRSAALPEVATIQEAGYSDAEYPTWFGLFVPAKTPRSLVNHLHRDTLRALKEPKVRDKLGTLGVDPMVMTPQQFDTHVQQDIAINAALIKAIGLQPQ